MNIRRSEFVIAVKKGDTVEVRNTLDRITAHEKRELVNTSKNASGSTPLFTAVWDGNEALVEVLLKHKAKVNWSNIRSLTPLGVALERGHVGVIGILLKYGAEGSVAELPGIKARFRKALPLKVYQHLTFSRMLHPDQVPTVHTDIQKQVMDNVLTGNYRGTLQAINKYPSLEAAETSLNLTDSRGWTPLVHSAGRGYLEITDLLIKKKAFMDFRDRHMVSPLSVAIKGNHYEVVELLLNAGANTSGVEMWQIQNESTHNIDKTMDALLSKFPPKDLVERAKPSVVKGMSLEDFESHREVFRYFDMNENGFISPTELRARLKPLRPSTAPRSYRGCSPRRRLAQKQKDPQNLPTPGEPIYRHRIFAEMLSQARSSAFHDKKGISFENFIDIVRGDAQGP